MVQTIFTWTASSENHFFFLKKNYEKLSSKKHIFNARFIINLIFISLAITTILLNGL